MDIHKAINESDLETVKYIVSNQEQIYGDVASEYALNYACENGKLEIIKYLLDKVKEDIGYIDKYTVQLASMEGHLDVVMYLCEADVIDIHPDEFNYTFQWAAQWAARNGNLEVVKYLHSYLQSKGAHIHTSTAIYWASIKHHYEIVKFLLEIGANKSDVMCLDKYKKYISFCEKMEKKIRDRAAKKIYYWWIPICYDLNR